MIVGTHDPYCPEGPDEQYVTPLGLPKIVIPGGGHLSDSRRVRSVAGNCSRGASTPRRVRSHRRALSGRGRERTTHEQAEAMSRLDEWRSERRHP